MYILLLLLQHINVLLFFIFLFSFIFHCSLCPLPPLPSRTTASPICLPTHPDSDSLSSPTRLSLSDGSEDQLDRLQQVELARTTPMSLWRAGTVQAWLEVVMAMPMYIRTCSENVKSGKVWQHLQASTCFHIVFDFIALSA